MMTNDSNEPEKKNDEAETAEAEAAREAAAEMDDAAAEPRTEDDPFAQLQKENAELKDRLMRALAEVENVRRRAEKDRQDAAKFGPSGLAKELLPAIDNLGRALMSVPDELRKGDDAVKNLVMGVEMIEKQFVDALSRFNIKRIDPVGEKFNYEHHQAMSEAEGTGHPPGTVAQVLQPGYVMHDRLLRPAMVIVAKGDPGADRADGHGPVDTTA